jgi:AcrR family transcriptional regulator
MPRSSPVDDEPPATPAAPSTYRRSRGTARGQARQRELLDAVADDIVEHGLADFSLRRAARAAGTTHKVLLYHFESAEDLLAKAVTLLRDRRIEGGLAATDLVGDASLADRVRAIWPIVAAEHAKVLDQAIGLAMYDPERHAALARGATEQYLPALRSFCPPHWSDERKLEVSQLILATLRGFLIDLRTSGDSFDAHPLPGMEALARALDREEAADRPTRSSRSRD